METPAAGGRANQKWRTRTAIVQAAAELAGAGGEVSMPEVAKAARVSEATAYRYFPDLASLLAEAIADQLPSPQEALASAGESADVVERVAAATEYLMRHILARQGAVRAMMAATVVRPGETTTRPGLRFGLIDQALAPLTARPGALDTGALAQLKRDLAVVMGAEALFTLIDLMGLDPDEAVASAVHTATVLTRAAVVVSGGGAEG